ncbi:hypothetical protein [Amycolatopsis aidingensis]|uniref:hypothetical protein n=1 Tax=Amycolatopsis aidingensis TaxID=2842453 RepID=UPI001C0AE917|nr:hypothetical protein [Amycolatopsis aidingensis]
MLFIAGYQLEQFLDNRHGVLAVPGSSTTAPPNATTSVAESCPRELELYATLTGFRLAALFTDPLVMRREAPYSDTSGLSQLAVIK